MLTPYPTPCDHVSDRGDKPLCPSCQEEYDIDPAAYEEYGSHPRGRANWAALNAEMDAARWRGEAAPDDSGVPF